MGAAAIERSHKTDGRVGCMREARVRERDHDALEIMRRDGDVGVADEQEFVLSVGNELCKCADFAVGAETLGALDQTNGVLAGIHVAVARQWRQRDRRARTRRRGSRSRRRSSGGSVLRKASIMPGSTPLSDLRMLTLGAKGTRGAAALSKEDARGEDGSEKIAHAGHGERRGHDLHG